jgi:hypothetical protein
VKHDGAADTVQVYIPIDMSKAKELVFAYNHRASFLKSINLHDELPMNIFMELGNVPDLLLIAYHY